MSQPRTKWGREDHRVISRIVGYNACSILKHVEDRGAYASWYVTQLLSILTIKLSRFFGGHKSFSWGHCYPCFGRLVMSVLSFKTRVEDPLYAFLLV